MSQRIHDALEVLGLMRVLYRRSPGRLAKDLRIEATRIVKDRGVAVDTVRAHYVNKNESNTRPAASVDQMAIDWIANGSRQLEDWYLETADRSESQAIREFFRAGGGLTPEAVDLGPPSPTERVPVETYRVLRDTALSRRVKAEMGHACQLCGHTVRLSADELYAESHHVRPLGGEHQGPDVRENILCVCPTCHVLLDYGAVLLDARLIRQVAQEYVEYHNKTVACRARQAQHESLGERGMA